MLKRRRKIDDDEDYFPIERYQDFSREAIVFYKRIGDHYQKWSVLVGIAFKKDKKFFIPVKIIGEPLRSRSTIVTYLMNLEVLKISKEIDKNFDFETIWPFILYLFNHWIRHQVRLMGLISHHPDLKPSFPANSPHLYQIHELDPSLVEA